MSRVLVTGATGFIGRALVQEFARHGYATRAAVRRAPPDDFPPGVELFLHADLAQRVDWSQALEGIDAVVHLAGIAHTGSRASEELYDRVNTVATERLAMAAAESGVRHFIFVSSIRAQSGPSADHILSERDTPAPTDVYGRSKLAAEHLICAAEVPFTILRPAVLYGPGAKANMALLARAAAWPLPLPLRSFTNRRSLLGIENFISAVRFALSTPAARGEIFVVCDPGPAPRIGDIIGTMRKARGRQPLLLPMPPRWIEGTLHTLGRHDLWERFGSDLQVDPRKLLSAGWRPTHDTLTGLAAFVKATASHPVMRAGAKERLRRLR